MKPSDWTGGPVVPFVPLFIGSGMTLHEATVYGTIINRYDHRHGCAKGITGRAFVRWFGGDRRTWTKAIKQLVSSKHIHIAGRSAVPCHPSKPGEWFGAKMRQTEGDHAGD